MSNIGLLKPSGQHAPVSQKYEAVVTSLTEAGPGLRVIRLTVEEGFRWKAGQYIWLGLGSFAPRPYSIANAPDIEGGVLEIHIKDTGAGGASSYAVKSLKPQEKVTVSAATGDNFYNPRRDGERPLLLIAGGMGIAPLKAIIEEALADKDASQDIWLYRGGRREADLYCIEYFAGLKEAGSRFHYFPVAEAPVGEAAACAFDDLSAFSIFLSGPLPMIDATLPLLQERGAKLNNIFYDRL